MPSVRFSFFKKVRFSVFQTLGFGIFILSILFFPIKSRAAVTDFFQTSQALEVNIFMPTIQSFIPDPDPTFSNPTPQCFKDQSMVTTMLLPFGDTVSALGPDAPFFLHLFRRNPNVFTLSEILVYLAGPP